MAGTIVLTSKTIGYDVNSRRNAIELLCTWVGDAANGTVPSLLVDGYPGWWITKVITNPGAVSPTTLYDITGIDADGFEIFEGALNNRSATLTETETMAIQIGVGGFTLALGNQSVVSAVGTIRMLLNR